MKYTITVEIESETSSEAFIKVKSQLPNEKVGQPCAIFSPSWEKPRTNPPPKLPENIKKILNNYFELSDVITLGDMSDSETKEPDDNGELMTQEEIEQIENLAEKYGRGTPLGCILDNPFFNDSYQNL